jgi:PAS domain S-box-containing protein
MNEISHRVAQMYAREQGLLSARVAMATRSYRIAVLSEALAALAAIALALATAYFYWRDVRARERARAELQEQKEWFSTTLASIADAVIVTDAEGHIDFINAVAQTLTGWARSDAAGRRLPDVFHIINGSTRRRAEDPAAKVLGSGAAAGLSNHTLLLSRDGKEIPIDDSAAPIRGSNGEIIGVVLVFRDIGERKATEAALLASERQLRMIADTAPVYLARVDIQLRYLFVNKSYAERFGLDRDTVIGKRIPDVVGEKAFATFKPYVERAFAGETVEFEIDIPYQQIGTHHMLVSYVPERDIHDRVCGLVAVITDITSRKRAEDQLKQADRQKDEFLAMLGHELRNPLAPIRTAVQILRRFGPTEPNLDKARAVIERQVGHLTRLVDDLLDVSRITHGKVVLQIQGGSLHERGKVDCRDIHCASRITLHSWVLRFNSLSRSLIFEYWRAPRSTTAITSAHPSVLFF